jgi:hypothetical protein
MRNTKRAVLAPQPWFGSLLSQVNTKSLLRMKLEAPSIFINDDEVDFKVIYVVRIQGASAAAVTP